MISFWQQPHPRVLLIYIANIAITQSSHLAQQLAAARLKQAYHLELPRPQFQPLKTYNANQLLWKAESDETVKKSGTFNNTQHGNWSTDTLFFWWNMVKQRPPGPWWLGAISLFLRTINPSSSQGAIQRQLSARLPRGQRGVPGVPETTGQCHQVWAWTNPNEALKSDGA